MGYDRKLRQSSVRNRISLGFSPNATIWLPLVVVCLLASFGARGQSPTTSTTRADDSNAPVMVTTIESPENATIQPLSLSPRAHITRMRREPDPNPLAGTTASECARKLGCGNMTYHGTFFSFQPVQHTQKVYTIFWNPSGTSFPAGYQETINQFVQDLNGSPYYGIAGQYDDSQGPISTTLLYGGTWRDTTNAIPSAFLTSQSDQILEDEVKRAKAANGWPDDQNSYFQVYTPSNVKSPAGSKAYCGFHTYDENFFSPNLAFGLILYPSDVPADGSSPGGTCFVSSPWPNSMIIDSAITVSAHEIMETVTDPYGSGWYYLDGTGEIGDLCSFTFGFRDSQSGSNVLLNGHSYIIQKEWSNASSGCVIGSGGSTTPTLTTGSATSITPTSVILSATVNPNGASTTLYFDYGTTTSYGTTVTSGVVGSGTSAVTQSYNLSNLSCGTTYQYRARAQNSSGTTNGGNQTFTSGSCAATVVAPSGLSAVALSSSSIAVSWVDNSNNETGFNVYRWTGSSWAQIATVGANVTSYTDTGLQPSTTYYHTVCVQNNATSGCASTFSTTTTQGSSSSTTPAAPSGVTASALSSSSIRVSWVDNSNNETGFNVYRWTGSSWTQIAAVGANVTGYTDTGLQPSTTYYHTVCVQNNTDSGCASTFSTATTQGSSSSTPPAAPSGVTASALSSSSIGVSWVDNSNNETGFTVYRWTGSSWAQIATVGANVTTYTDTGLQPSTTYYHTVCVQNNVGSSCASTFSTTTTQGSSSSTTPAAPSGVTASALSSSAIEVSWVDNSNNETGFTVYRWTGSFWAQIATVGANVTSYADTGLQASTTYYHTVCVQNNAGSSCANTFSTANTF